MHGDLKSNVESAGGSPWSGFQDSRIPGVIFIQTQDENKKYVNIIFFLTSSIIGPISTIFFNLELILKEGV